MTSFGIDEIPGLRRIENVPLPELAAVAEKLTKPAYPHEQIYGNYCSLEEYVACPPEDVFRYLADVTRLAEWTYSLRGFEPTESPGLFVARDRVGGGETKIFTKTVANEEAMTVDYHCAWDQSQKLWMIYLMRVVPAELVLDRPGSVVLWSNCKHPYYDQNPFPETAPAGRPVWVGDFWPQFYAGHYIEMQNLKAILEYRHAKGIRVVTEASR